MTTDTAPGFERETVIAEPVAVEALVRQWLEEIDAGSVSAGARGVSRHGHALCG